MATIKINGMSCQHCVASVTKAIEAIEGVTSVNVDLDKKEATYEGDADEQQIKAAVKGIGFEAE